MHTIAAFFCISTVIQQEQTASENTGQTYGYIALAALILIVVVVVLIRRQHRKFNE